MTFDFNRAKLQVAGSVESVELLEDYNGVGHKLASLHARTSKRTSVNSSRK